MSNLKKIQKLRKKLLKSKNRLLKLQDTDAAHAVVEIDRFIDVLGRVCLHEYEWKSDDETVNVRFVKQY